MERSGPAAFAAAMVSDSDAPEIIWTHKMRAQNLIRQVFFAGYLVLLLYANQQIFNVL